MVQIPSAFVLYIDLFTQKERRPNTLRDRKRAEPLWADTEAAGEGG